MSTDPPAVRTQDIAKCEPTPPVVVHLISGERATETDEEFDTSPCFDYLRSPEGHEIAKGVLGIVQDIKKAAVQHTATNARLEKLLQIGIVFVVVIAATVLAAMNKLDGPVGILFGTLVGYVFGRRS